MKRFTFTILLAACTGDKSDTGVEASDNLQIGTCLHYGEIDSAGDSVLKCIQPTGSQWTPSNFQTACESDLDNNGTYQNANDTCPEENLVGLCDVPNGGYLIGASYESNTGGFSGLLHYYSDDSSTEPASACGQLLGEYSAAE